MQSRHCVPLRLRAGFTLLEMLVVLTLMGLLIGMVAPSYINRLDATEQQFRVDEYRASLTQLPRWAMVRNEAIRLDAQSESLILGDQVVLDLPEGWRAVFDPPLRISTTQICSSSAVKLWNASGELAGSYSVIAPDCRVEIAE